MKNKHSQQTVRKESMAARKQKKLLFEKTPMAEFQITWPKTS